MQNFIKRVITRVLKTERFQKWIAAWVVLLLLAFVAVSLYREFRKTEEIELLQMEERKPPQAFFHLGDSLGSSQVVVDGSGLVVQVNSYSPYGEILSEPHKEQSIDHLYTGQELDRSTGLYNYGARAYDSATSRFLSVDRVHQSPSPYTYSGNSPVQYLDPDGNSYKESDGSSLQPIMTADLRTIDIGSIKRLHPWDPTVDLKTLPPHVELRAISHSNGSKTYFLRERPMVIMDPDISVRFFGRSLQREKPSPEKTKLPEEFVVFVKGFLEEEIQEQGRGPTEFISWNLFNDKKYKEYLYVMDPAHPGTNIDMRHFIAAAYFEARKYRGFTELGGLAYEVFQIGDELPGFFIFGPRRSAIHPHDYYSNALGVEFGRYFYDPQGAPFWEQLTEYFLYRRIIGESVVISPKDYPSKTVR